MQINFVVTPTVLSEDFAQVANNFLGVSLETRGLKTPLFLKNLLTLKHGGSIGVEEAGSLLRHLSYSILLKDSAESVRQIQSESSLFTLRLPPCLDGDVMLLLSGNLEAIRTEVINGCTDAAEPHFREFTTKLLLRLDEQGLGPLFHSFARRIKPHTNSLVLTGGK